MVGSVAGWVAGLLENWRVMLISTQIVVKVEVEVDIGKKHVNYFVDISPNLTSHNHPF